MYELFANFVIPIASLAVSIASMKISENARNQAREITERNRSDWLQKQWFDLYVECNTAYDSLDRFQTLAKSFGGVSPTELQLALGDVVIQF